MTGTCADPQTYPRGYRIEKLGTFASGKAPEGTRGASLGPGGVHIAPMLKALAAPEAEALGRQILISRLYTD
ncbi:hypothetical protein PSM7751_02891 [Pseudooceanicola marinus]|uniref:Uncharacterized protein n=1 Tax=Pseudooceanicola marinus TaxID=396013 RepID=A0A1X6ZPB8_9RHOB|nr:hypothetical protein CVM50_18855 [Pseudooceanicola marinus]SLN57538.1 hypothetical protein PSM7751_02891 [Pseudooceanicola marinus]